MLQPIQNNNAAAQFLQPAIVQGLGPATPGNGNFLDGAQFSPELMETAAAPGADMVGLLRGLQDLAVDQVVAPASQAEQRGLNRPGQAGLPLSFGQPRQPQGPMLNGQPVQDDRILGKGAKNQAVSTPDAIQRAHSRGDLGQSKLAGKQLLVELDSQELQAMYGELGPLMGQLGATRPEVTLVEAGGIFQCFKSDPMAAPGVVEFLGNRKDVKLEETFTAKPGGGTPEVHPPLKDTASRQMLYTRRDLKPADMTRMGNRFAAALGDPMMAADAYKDTVPLLGLRRDLHPDYMGSMMEGMSRRVGDPAATLRMYKSAVKTLSTRADINTGDMMRLVGGVADMGKKDGNTNPTRVANAFEDANSLLQEQPGRGVGDVIQLTQILGGPGAGPGAGGEGAGGQGQPGGGQPGAAPMGAAQPQPGGVQAVPGIGATGAQAPRAGQAAPGVAGSGLPDANNGPAGMGGGKKDRLGMFSQGLNLMRAAPELDATSVAALVMAPRPTPGGAMPGLPGQQDPQQQPAAV